MRIPPPDAEEKKTDVNSLKGVIGSNKVFINGGSQRAEWKMKTGGQGCDIFRPDNSWEVFELWLGDHNERTGDAYCELQGMCGVVKMTTGTSPIVWGKGFIVGKYFCDSCFSQKYVTDNFFAS